MPALVIGNKSQGQLVAGLQLAGIDLRADLGDVAMGDPPRRLRRAPASRGANRPATTVDRVVTQIAARAGRHGGARRRRALDRALAGGARHRRALGRALAGGAGLPSPSPAARQAAGSCCPTRPTRSPSRRPRSAWLQVSRGGGGRPEGGYQRGRKARPRGRWRLRGWRVRRIESSVGPSGRGGASDLMFCSPKMTDVDGSAWRPVIPWSACIRFEPDRKGPST